MFATTFPIRRSPVRKIKYSPFSNHHTNHRTNPKTRIDPIKVHYSARVVRVSFRARRMRANVSSSRVQPVRITHRRVRRRRRRHRQPNRTKHRTQSCGLCESHCTLRPKVWRTEPPHAAHTTWLQNHMIYAFGFGVAAHLMLLAVGGRCRRNRYSMSTTTAAAAVVRWAVAFRSNRVRMMRACPQSSKPLAPTAVGCDTHTQTHKHSSVPVGPNSFMQCEQRLARPQTCAANRIARLAPHRTKHVRTL